MLYFTTSSLASNIHSQVQSGQVKAVSRSPFNINDSLANEPQNMDGTWISLNEKEEEVSCEISHSDKKKGLSYAAKVFLGKKHDVVASECGNLTLKYCLLINLNKECTGGEGRFNASHPADINTRGAGKTLWKDGK